MTLAGRTLDDLGAGLSMRSLLSFASHLPPSSALMAELSPACGWPVADQLLARLCEDVEAAMAALSGGRARRIPRPGVAGDPRERRVGSDPIPVSEFDDWYYRR